MPKIYFFSFINSLEYKLLIKFIEYYLKINIKPENMYIILHIQEKYKIDNDKYNNLSIRESINILNKHKIKFRIVNHYSSKIKKDYVNSYIKELEINSWLIYPDLDEFFNYRNKCIYSFIDGMERKKISLINGIFLNRLSKNYELKEVNLKKNIFKQYPLTFYDDDDKISKNYSKTKIMALKIYENTEYYNSHKILNYDKYKVYKKIYDVNHFKFTKYTIRNLKNKIKVYNTINPKRSNKYKNQLKIFTKKNNKWYINKDIYIKE